MPSIRLIHWDPIQAEQHAVTLSQPGYDVDFSPINSTSLRALWSSPPTLIIIDLTRIPSQGRDLALMIRRRKSTRLVPLIFAGGKPETVARIKELLPDAQYVTWESIADAITYGIQNPPLNPVVPHSSMAAYAGTPLPQKLGIKPGSTVYIINAPQDFQTTLGKLPQNVSMLSEYTIPVDLTLWFVHSEKELLEGMNRMLPLAHRDGIWIIWPKNSVKKTGLSQTVVRKTGLDAGLVDYKIASIDDTWSGLRFTIRNDG